MIKKLSVLAAFLVVSSTLFASSNNDATLSLPGGGDVSFSSPMKLNLNPIPVSQPGDVLVYDVHCTLSNNATSSVYVHFGLGGPLYPDTMTSFTLGGQYVQGFITGLLKSGSSELVASKIATKNTGAYIIINNLDTTNNISVSNCYAVPHYES